MMKPDHWGCVEKGCNMFAYVRAHTNTWISTHAHKHAHTQTCSVISVVSGSEVSLLATVWIQASFSYILTSHIILIPSQSASPCTNHHIGHWTGCRHKSKFWRVWLKWIVTIRVQIPHPPSHQVATLKKQQSRYEDGKIVTWTHLTWLLLTRHISI